MSRSRFVNHITGKLGRNDPCWCGSGKKYKKCHLDRAAMPALPWKAVETAAKKAAAHKTCMHPLAQVGVCNKIISAHTIQRSRVLQAILDHDNRVRSFYPTEPQPNGMLKLHLVGWRQASTFTGFCALHDQLTFRPLEAVDFAGTAEQCFLVGYRAVCHEVFQKSSNLLALPTIRDLADRGMAREHQENVQELWTVFEAGTRKGLADFQRIKAWMDRDLLSREYSSWSRCILSFKGELCLASTGAVSVNRDFDGNELQRLHDFDADIEPLIFGIVSAKSGGAFVIVWRKGQNAPQAFMECLLSQPKDRMPGLLAQFVFACVENTYFSDSWWQSLSAAGKKQITSLAGVSNAYYTNFRYSPQKFVPWIIEKISTENVD